MSTTAIHAARADKDVFRIANVAVRSSRRVSGKIRARVVEEYRTGRFFSIAPYITKQLHGVLTNSMLAGHLAGYRRAWLMQKQDKTLRRKVREGLKLSLLDDALEILRLQTELDITALQAKYNTEALRILNNVSIETETELRATIKELIANGEPVRSAVRILGEKFDKLGLSADKPYQLEAIFRTQLQLAFGAGKYTAEQDPDIQEILWGYKYVTVGDDRVRETHAALEGVTLPKDDPFWRRFYPPNGWNCRCQAIPIFEQREIKEAPKTIGENGEPLTPDKGFDFNPGFVFTTAI